MKVQVKLFFMVILLLSSGVSSRAAGFTVNERQTRELKNFSAIKVSSGIDLYLSMGSRETVQIEASDKIINDVITEVKNETLHIYVKRKNWFNLFNWSSNNKVKAYVTVEKLNELKASSGSQVRTENELSGSSLDLDASSGSGTELELVYKELKLNASSGAKMDVRGRCKNLQVKASSGSDIDARRLESANCRAEVSSGGHISLHVTNTLEANASSGGTIRYAGNPERRAINQSSGGTISGR